MSGLNNFISDYGPYLNDLQRRLYNTVVFFALTFVTSFFATSYIIKAFIKIFKVDAVTVVVTSPFQFLDLSVDIGLFIAIILTIPVLVKETYLFIRPALSRRERRIFFMMIPVGMGLYLTGFAYGFFSLYFGLSMIAGVNVGIGLTNLWDIGLFLSQLTLTSALLGLLFLFPIVVTGLIRLGVFDINFLILKRRIAYALIFVFVALLPPTDGLSLLIMSLPLAGLYEMTIFYNRVFGPKISRGSIDPINNLI